MQIDDAAQTLPLTEGTFEPLQDLVHNDGVGFFGVVETGRVDDGVFDVVDGGVVVGFYFLGSCLDVRFGGN